MEAADDYGGGYPASGETATQQGVRGMALAMHRQEVSDTEFVAKTLAAADGHDWAALPESSFLWFADKAVYRARAKTAMGAYDLCRAMEQYQVARKGES